MTAPQRAARPLFMITIVVGSFLLFMVQPMVARAALPRLGGAPNVWNSAMLVYQALLLGGYAYAHWLGRFSVRVQAVIHVSLLALAALTLPVHLVPLAPPTAGMGGIMGSCVVCAVDRARVFRGFGAGTAHAALVFVRSCCR